jgi:ribonuclease R
VSEQDASRRIKRNILELLKKNGNKAFRAKEIAHELGYRDNADFRRFEEVLAELDAERVVARAKGGRYAYKPRTSKIEGVLRVNAKGFGFLEVEGREEDYFVRESNMKTALDGDRVLVGLAAPARGDRRREAEVLRVLERKRTQTVGTFQRQGHFAFVVPDDKRLTQDIYVPEDAFNGASNGDKVVVSIDRFDDRKASPEGRILQVIGSSDDASVRVLSLAMSLDVRSGFPDEVIAEAESIPEAIPPEEFDRRVDLRGKPVFTIDPVDAQDFDDAIHVLDLPNGNLEVGVHIADVSHYVRPNTALDAEALERGTSVYLVDRVIPMLPEKLSNKVCSLRPDEDKLAFSIIMEVTPHGEVREYEIAETVIRSHRRFTYEEAQDFVQGGYPEREYAQHVVRAARLSRTLTGKRMRSGSVDFDIPEIRVILDESGHPVDIVRKERIEANRLIEELMLMANRTVAEHIGMRRGTKPFVYRIHDAPDSERIAKLAEYVRAFGHDLKLSNGKVDSRDLNKLFEKVKNTPEEPVIEQAALRAMSKAVYSTENIGHFGLAFDHYSHFTSPIRRYPDLMVHRLLKQYARHETRADEQALESRCKHCSEREVIAVEAERESVKLKQVEYIREHVGDAFDGVVSGVTKFGIFVELSDLLVEGMVHVRDLDDDYYEYDERTYSLVGKDSGRAFKLGSRVRVQVAGANLESREVDFVFVDGTAG